MIKTDVLIVGQGISGTILAHHLEERGIDFMIIDNAPQSSSSKVAGGVYNPVVFKRLTMSWRAFELLDYLDEYYSNWESKFNKKIHFKRKVLKILANEEERKFWLKRSKEEPFNKLLSNELILDNFNDYIRNDFGLGPVLRSGNVDINSFLETSRNEFFNSNKLINGEFDWLKYKSGSKSFNNIFFNKIIACDGWLSTKNPFFSYLPFNLAKGEILTIKMNDYPAEDIINKRAFILPLGNNEYRVGSTYQWTFTDDKPTDEEKAFLLDKLNGILIKEYEIVDHSAGIRPATKDRRPILGAHPEIEELFIFNGMGSKGVMLAPLLAKDFVDYLLDDLAIQSEVDIKRFQKYS
mgnify:CR=1 FL=1